MGRSNGTSWEDAPTAKLDAEPSFSDSGRVDSQRLDPQRLDEVPSRYVLLETVGVGAMGTVFRAYDGRLRREVALKRLNADAMSSDARARMLREAQALAKLSHPNVVNLFAVEDAKFGVWLVMEYVDGVTLEEWLARNTAAGPSWKETLRVVRAAGLGLAAAHDRGLLHRDFKPSNVLVTADGRVKVVDFGLARSQHGSASAASAWGTHDNGIAADSASSELDAELTETGTVMGTPAYMAPEQHFGQAVDERADQYAYCVTLWRALTGALPFASRSGYEALLREKLDGPPAWPSGGDVPRRIAEAIRRGLHRQRDARWPSMAALLRALDERERWRGRWVVMAGAGAIASSGWAFAALPSSAPCSGAERHLRGAWDPARREAMASAWNQLQGPHAEPLRTRLQARLDAYADRWIAAHTEACEATTVRREVAPEIMDRRMACLQRAAVQLQANVDVLLEPDPELVLDAHTLVDGLPSLARCTSADPASITGPEPTDPEHAARTRDLEQQLARANALGDAGKYQLAAEILERVRYGSAGIDDERLLDDLDRAEALGRNRLGDSRTAETLLRAAFERSLRRGDWSRVVDAGVELGDIVGVHQARPAEAMIYLDLAATMARRIGADELELASLEVARARVLQQKGELHLAELGYRHALAVRERVLGADDLAVVDVRSFLGVALELQGRYGEAEHELRAAIEGTARALGSDHPYVFETRNDLAKVLVWQGRYQLAEAEFRTALAGMEAAFGPEHPIVATYRNNVANILQEQGRFAEAEVEHRRVLELRKRLLAPDHPEIAQSRQNLGLALDQQGRHEEAEAEYREAIEAWTEVFGPEHTETLRGRFVLAQALYGQGRLDDAEREFRATLALQEKILGRDHAAVAMTLHQFAPLLVDRGRLDEARAMLERGYRINARAGSATYTQAGIAFGLAQLLWDVEGERARAVTLAEQALAFYTPLREWYPDEYRETAQWLRGRAD